MKNFDSSPCIVCGSSDSDIESYGPRKTCKRCHTSLFHDEWGVLSLADTIEYRLCGTRWFIVPRGTLLILASEEI